MGYRAMSVADLFYPKSCEAIKHYFRHLKKSEIKSNFKAKAIIVPHAGYVFSGYTADAVYQRLDAKVFKRVVVVGPSHRVYFKGASIALYDSYETPCGNMEIDLAYSQALMQKYDFLSFSDKLHEEHSTETQMPFINHYFPSAKVMEIVYSDIDPKEMIPLFQALMDEGETLLVVSSDLSHFYSLKEANKKDKICIDAIDDLDVQALDNGCEACGMLGINALLSVAKESQIVDYRTSYDASGDDVRVVGYLSVLLR